MCLIAARCELRGDRISISISPNLRVSPQKEIVDVQEYARLELKQRMYFAKTSTSLLKFTELEA